jgi:hypothetical protein
MIDLPLRVTTDGATADNGVVARLIERIAVVRIQIEVDGSERVSKRLGLLAALAVHPGEIAKWEWCRLGRGLLARGSRRRRLSGRRL